jgi:rRNA-processing protein FCF1
MEKITQVIRKEKNVVEEEEDSKIQILQDFIFDISQNDLKTFKSRFITEVSSSDKAEIITNDTRIRGRLRNRKVKRINYQEI